MTRRLLNIAPMLSLLVCLAMVVLWIRSDSSSDALDFGWQGRTGPDGLCSGIGVSIGSSDSHLRLLAARFEGADPRVTSDFSKLANTGLIGAVVNSKGRDWIAQGPDFILRRVNPSFFPGSNFGFEVGVPYWFVVMFLVVITGTVWLVRRRAARGRRLRGFALEQTSTPMPPEDDSSVFET